MHAAYLLFLAVLARCQIHIANDNYFLEKQRLRRDTGTTTCADGMTTATRNIFDQTIANGKIWDCTLEAKAQAVIKECLSDNGGATNGTLKLSFSLTDNSTAESIISDSQTALGLAAKNLNSDSDVKEIIGCSYAQCEERVDILCLYSRSATTTPLP
ncbi:unnamed protein product [Caenorhabditis sp. 36 PRJEB53466]|nr:unnamed protein product [Caenorhabditis sp. 36 PRJEB53466]